VELVLIELSRISLIEEKWLEEPPNRLVPPMFSHDVGRIELTRQMIETNEPSGNSFTNAVE
jgi:hypothetical protein